MGDQSQKSRPPPISGTKFPPRVSNSAGAGPAFKATLGVHKIKKPAQANIAQLKQIGGSIPKLSDHADKLGIKLKNYDSPVLGIHGTLRSRPMADPRRKTAPKPRDLIAKFDSVVNNTEIDLSNTISQNLQQMSANAIRKAKPQTPLAHSFLLGDKATIEEEMSKLHEMVASETDQALGYGFDDKKSMILANKASLPTKGKNSSTDSERPFRPVKAKVDNKVTQWMKSNPGLKKVMETSVLNNQYPKNKFPSTGGDVNVENGHTYMVNDKLKQISDQFHNSLRDATRDARELIKTPDDDYIRELSKQTQDSLAKMSITEGDIDSVFRNAIQREQYSNTPLFRLTQRDQSLQKPLFQPLHADQETKKKLHNYIAKRKEPFAPRPPRKDFEKDYENPTQLFKGADYTHPMEMQKRRSLIDASEPQIFQRTIDSGQLDNHRKIVDPNYPHGSITQRTSRWYPSSAKNSRDFKGMEKGFSNAGGNQTRMPLKANAESQQGAMMVKEGEEKTYRNSRSDLTNDAINRKLERSAKNIEDATKVANALGTLMSKVALAGDNKGESPMELTGRLQPPPVGSKALRTLQSPESRQTSIATLAEELRQMAQDTNREFYSQRNNMQQQYTNFDEMKSQNLLKYTRKNNLSLLPGVSFTDQMLLKKLKSMDDFAKQQQ